MIPFHDVCPCPWLLDITILPNLRHCTLCSLTILHFLRFHDVTQSYISTIFVMPPPSLEIPSFICILSILFYVGQHPFTKLVALSFLRRCPSNSHAHCHNVVLCVSSTCGGASHLQIRFSPPNEHGPLLVPIFLGANLGPQNTPPLQNGCRPRQQLHCQVSLS